MQQDLFCSPREETWQRIDAPDADIRFKSSFLDEDTARRYFDELLVQVKWRQDRIRVYGKLHDVPRLHQWYGEPDTAYAWSGLVMAPQPFIPALLRLRAAIETATSATYNSILANLYRDGNDAVGWHSDDEPEFRGHPTIASLSLGAARDFVLRHRHRPDLPQIKISLTNGSLLVMSGNTQENWQHTIPKRAGVVAPRINLTLRTSVQRAEKKKRTRQAARDA